MDLAVAVWRECKPLRRYSVSSLLAMNNGIKGTGTFFDCLPSSLERLEDYVSNNVLHQEMHSLRHDADGSPQSLSSSKTVKHLGLEEESRSTDDGYVDLCVGSVFFPVRSSGWEHVVLPSLASFTRSDGANPMLDGESKRQKVTLASSYVKASNMLGATGSVRASGGGESRGTQQAACSAVVGSTANSITATTMVSHSVRENSGEMESLYDRLKGAIRKEVLSTVLGMRVLTAVEIRETDIVGLEKVKQLIKEKVIYPIKRPELHHGLRQAPKGVLLFGPPGTGKTMIAKWIAAESGATFFAVRPSSLLSKFYGETELTVSALFQVAEVCAPSVIFVDEVDALFGKRRDQDQEACIRMKNELLQGMDGLAVVGRTTPAATKMVTVVGATNRPDALDTAAVRRFTRRIMVPLPEVETRIEHIRHLLMTQNNIADFSNSASRDPPERGDDDPHPMITLSESQLRSIALRLDGWSAADIRALCMRAADFPYKEALRKYGTVDDIPNAQVFRPIQYDDLIEALHEVRPSSMPGEEQRLREWEKDFGSC